MTERTLIYPGAGWDFDFYQYFKSKGYSKFILYDTLPEYKHYRKEHAGWAKQEKFFETLKEEFGEYDQNVEEKCLTFPSKNIKYYYSTNAELITVPDGDIFIRGYMPQTWESKGYFDNRIVFLSDDTVGTDCSDWDSWPIVRLYGDLASDYESDQDDEQESD